MPKKTLALIAGLVLVTVVLFVIALNSSKAPIKDGEKQSSDTTAPSPTASVAHSVLSLSPNPITVAPGSVGRVDVNLDTADNNVTAVQLELSYDPKVISNVQVLPGPFFQNAIVLINKNNSQTGTYTYAFGKAPGQEPVIGTGAVATISFTASVSSQPSTMTLLPTSLVTARGIASSVLKTSSGTQIIVSPGAANSVPPVRSSSPSAGL